MKDAVDRDPDTSDVLDVERQWTTGGAMVWLWSGIMLGPLGWTVHLNVSYGVATLTCPGSPLWLAAITLVAVAMAGTGGLLAWRAWAAIGEGDTHDGSVIGRSRFMGVLGVWLSGLFAIVVLVQSLPPFFFAICE